MTDSDDNLPRLLSPDELPKLTRRLVDAAVSIEEADIDTPEFLHAILCQIGLPRSRVDGRTFDRSSGNASLLIEGGKIFKGGKWIDAPVPYGTKPRLVLYHLCSEAVRTQSPEIDMGGSMAEYLRRIGIHHIGRGTRQFKEQMLSLAACRMTIGMFNGGRVRQIKTDPVHSFEAWLAPDPNQRAFWADEITLGQEFFETLCEHAVPLDPRAIHALQHSALALDVYTWMAHRLCRVRKRDGVKLSWRNLKEQFGQEYKTSKDFKREFKAALFKARCVYSSARIEEEIGGIRLFSSSPPIKKTNVLVSLPNG